MPTKAEREARAAEAAQTLRAYYPPGSTVYLMERPGPNRYAGELRTLVAWQNSTGLIVQETTSITAAACGITTHKTGAINATLHSSTTTFEAIKAATGHELKYSRV